jgi:mannose-6-phosphate isomerase-like protein (cupin superfamily)
MKRLLPMLWCGSMMLAYFAGQGSGPSSVEAQQPPAPAGALGPGLHSKIRPGVDQGEPTLFPAENLRKAHAALSKSAGGGVATSPKEFFTPAITRTHSYIMVHRPESRSAQTAEQHEGVTDVYFVVGGTGTVFVGGEIENRRVSRPGEYLGTNKGGKPFRVEAGSILNIPPDVVHAAAPDAGGLTYVLMKVNVGAYPWSLVNGTP